MKPFKIELKLAALSLLVLLLQSCAGTGLITAATEPSHISGTYTLYLYGCHYPDQAHNVAILIDENSKYPFEIYDLDTSYKVKKGVEAQQALREADTFLHCTSHSIWQTQVMRIPDDQGGTVGYEVRPLYHFFEFGAPDVILTHYWLNKGRIRAYIKIIPQLENLGSGERSRGGSQGSQ